MGGLEIVCASGEGSVRMVGLLLQGVWGSLLVLEGAQPGPLVQTCMAVAGSQSCLMVQTPR